MTNVTATATDGDETNGVYNHSSSPTMTNVTATATGGNDNSGVYNLSSVPVTMNNVIATATDGSASYGVYNKDSTANIRNSSLTATGATNDNFSIQTEGQQTAFLAHTTLDGTVGQVSQCFWVYDETFTEINC